MKDYEKNKSCTLVNCTYYSVLMELNCSYSEDNSKCVKTDESIKRYDIDIEVDRTGDKYVKETEDKDGDWIKYEDYIKEKLVKDSKSYWIDINSKEDLPKNRDDVIIGNLPNNCVSVGWYNADHNNGEGKWIIRTAHFDGDVTHWQPLPKLEEVLKEPVQCFKCNGLKGYNYGTTAGDIHRRICEECNGTGVKNPKDREEHGHECEYDSDGGTCRICKKSATETISPLSSNLNLSVELRDYILSLGYKEQLEGELLHGFYIILEKYRR